MSPRGVAVASGAVLAAVTLLAVGTLAAVPGGIAGGVSLIFSAGNGCAAGGAGAGGGGPSSGEGPGTAVQPAVSAAGRNSIPAQYLALYQRTGRRYGVPWVVLAGIGRVESNHGRSTLPGVHSGANAFGAAGPMQIGIEGASGNTWGGAPVHPAGQRVSGVATDANGDGVASVYEPADAIAGAARYLLRAGVSGDVSGAIFAYNHLESYVRAVLYWAGVYAGGGYSVTGSGAGAAASARCVTLTAGQRANRAVSAVIGYGRRQLGKPYLWGGTGPDAFDCSGLVMMAYRAAGIGIPRTSQQQWAWGPRVPAGLEKPGDLVFFAGSDGTQAAPGHVGLVIGNGLMIEAYGAGVPVRIVSYRERSPVGFTRPWAHPGVSTGSH